MCSTWNIGLYTRPVFGDHRPWVYSLARDRPRHKHQMEKPGPNPTYLRQADDPSAGGKRQFSVGVGTILQRKITDCAKRRASCRLAKSCPVRTHCENTARPSDRITQNTPGSPNHRIRLALEGRDIRSRRNLHRIGGKARHMSRLQPKRNPAGANSSLDKSHARWSQLS